MSIRERILTELQTARKTGLKDRALILSTVFGEIQTKEKQAKEVHEFNDAETTALLKSGVKVRTKTAETYVNAGHQERADRENLEIQIISEFLPEPVSAGTIQGIVSDAIAGILTTEPELTPRHMGRIIGIVKKLEPEADGAMVSSIVKELMAELS